MYIPGEMIPHTGVYATTCGCRKRFLFREGERFPPPPCGCSGVTYRLVKIVYQAV